MDLLNLYRYCPSCKSDLEFIEIDGEKVKKCIKCHFVFWNKSKPVTSIIIPKDGKVLMLQRAKEPFKDYWVLPGGFIKPMETAEEAVLRESKEEIGLNISTERILGTYLIDTDPRGVHLDIIFIGKADEEIKLSNEDIKCGYFSPSKLPEKIAYRHREAIQDYARSKND